MKTSFDVTVEAGVPGIYRDHIEEEGCPGEAYEPYPSRPRRF